MNGRVFLDTNIFVYLYDSDHPGKQARARALVERFGLSGEIVISTQVLQEFYASVTRKFSRQLSEEQILLATRSLGRLPLVQVNVGMIFEAISLGLEVPTFVLGLPHPPGRSGLKNHRPERKG